MDRALYRVAVFGGDKSLDLLQVNDDRVAVDQYMGTNKNARRLADAVKFGKYNTVYILTKFVSHSQSDVLMRAGRDVFHLWNQGTTKLVEDIRMKLATPEVVVVEKLPTGLKELPPALEGVPPALEDAPPALEEAPLEVTGPFELSEVESEPEPEPEPVAAYSGKYSDLVLNTMGLDPVGAWTVRRIMEFGDIPKTCRSRTYAAVKRLYSEGALQIVSHIPPETYQLVNPKKETPVPPENCATSYLLVRDGKVIETLPNTAALEAYILENGMKGVTAYIPVNIKMRAEVR